MNRRNKMSMLMVAVATLGATALTPASASAAQTADDQPTTRELLEKCNDGTDKCVFHPAGSPVESMGEAHQVGDMAFNCTTEKQRSAVSWADTTGETNTVGVSMSAEYGFTELFKVTITASYEHSWQSSHTEEQSTNVEVPAGEVGWITREAAMEEINGTYEMHFEDKFYGHHIWYVPFTAKGPRDAPSTKTQHTRKMTDKEKKEHCG